MLQLYIETFILDWSPSPIIVIVVAVYLVRHLLSPEFLLFKYAPLNQFFNGVLVPQSAKALAVHVRIDLNLIQLHMHGGVTLQFHLHIFLELLNCQGGLHV